MFACVGWSGRRRLGCGAGRNGLWSVFRTNEADGARQAHQRAIRERVLEAARDAARRGAGRAEREWRVEVWLRT